jgi:surface polysaccharide O-acyltransferase-like enzyme
VLCAVGIIATLAATYLGVGASVAKGEPSYIMNTPFSVPSFVVAVVIFLIVKGVFSGKGKCSDNVVKVSNTTLGIYLLHPLILDLLPQIVFDCGKVCAVIAIPVITLAIAIICFVITNIILYIPIIKRLIS